LLFLGNETREKSGFVSYVSFSLCFDFDPTGSTYSTGRRLLLVLIFYHRHIITHHHIINSLCSAALLSLSLLYKLISSTVRSTVSRTLPELYVTSSGARAMRGFGAMSLLRLRRSRCVFLAPPCTALRCPWVSALLVPVVRVPSCARGLPCVFVYCTCTTDLYCTVVL